MALPTLERPGARLGGVTQTTASVSCRTDSAGVNLYLDVAHDPAFTAIIATSAAAALNSANNYTATAHVTGLAPGTRYHWRVRAGDSGDANVAVGSGLLFSGSFRTLHSRASRRWVIWGLGCMQLNTGAEFNRRLSQVFSRIRASDPLACMWIDDIDYVDAHGAVGSGNYGAGVYMTWPKDTSINQAEREIRARTNYYSRLDEEWRSNHSEGMNVLMAQIPTWWMYGDHDGGFNDRDGYDAHSATAWQVDAIRAMNKVNLELFGALNKHHLEASQPSSYTYSTDTESETDKPIHYHYIDVPPVRFVVLDCRAFRSSKGATDNASKTMLGAAQKQWLKDAIRDNPQPFLAIVSSLMFDGDHDYNPGLTTFDGWKGWSTEREEILDYIWSVGNPHRTVILSFDTHVACAAKYTGQNQDRPAIYEVTNASLWNTPNHSYVTGFGNQIYRTGETAAAVGYGGRLQMMRTNINSVTKVTAGPGYMEVAAVQVYDNNGIGGYSTMQPFKTLWSRRFE